MLQRPVASLMKRFRDNNNGSVTIEFLMWVPVLVGLVTLTVQVTMLFMTQSNYWSVARDTARLVARHAMTEAAAETYAVLQAGSQTVTPTAAVAIGASTVTVTLSVPAASVTPYAAFGFLENATIDATVIQALEPI